MIFQPAIIALLLASLVSAALLAGAAPYALEIIRFWDLRSGSERQLALERRTYLLSTVASFVFATQVVALLLFVFNADRMAAMIVGAMCAVGTLSVNNFGFPALISQIVLFFAAVCWLIINHVDERSPDYPLLRTKYVLLLLLLPLVLVMAALQFRFFLGIKADVITSCCGSLFSEENEKLGGALASVPVRPAMIGFYSTLALAILAPLYYRWRGTGAYVVAALSALAFVAAIVGILSFLSLYIYEHPNHHCPFCVLKPEYGYGGYWLYLPLFSATAAGLGIGALQPFAARPGLSERVPRLSRRLAGFAAGMFLLFALIASVMIARSRLVLLG